MNDFKLFGGFVDRRTNERTLVVLESLWRLKIVRMVRNAQKMISRKFFIVGYFPHLGGGGVVNEVWKISTQFFFFEGFP